MGLFTVSKPVRLLLGLAILGIPGFPAAESASGPAPNENSALLSKINGLYYNYKTLGLHQLKCEVKVSMFEKLLKMLQSKVNEDDKRVKALKDVRFFVSYDEKNGYQFNYSNYKPTGDPKTDEGALKILDGSSKIVGGFWKIWQEMVFGPAINSVKNSVQVKKTGSGYEITENGSKNILNQDLLITEVDAASPGKPDGAVTIKPSFLKTNNGLLIQSMAVEVPKYMIETIGIDYQDVQKYKFPSTVNFSIDMLGSMKTDITLQFLNCQLN